MLRERLSAALSLPASASLSLLRLRPRRLLLRVRATASSPSARSLRLLGWGKVCDAVASFAGTAHGRDATKAQLWGVEDVSYEESRRLLQETEAAVRLLDNAGGTLDFSGLDTVAVMVLLMMMEVVKSLTRKRKLVSHCLVVFIG